MTSKDHSDLEVTVPADLNTDQIRQLAMAIAEDLAAQRQQRSSWPSRTNLTVAIFAIASIVFSIGMNWSRVGSLEDTQKTNSSTIQQVQNDLMNVHSRLEQQNGDSRVINEKLDSIQRELARLEGQVVGANKVR